MKKTGGRCGAPAMRGRKTCCKHSGGSAVGLASAASTADRSEGRYSAYLDQSLQGRYKAALADQSLLDLTDDVALLEVRVMECAERLKKGHSSEVWSNLKSAADRLEKAMEARSPDRLADAIRDVVSLVRDGLSVEHDWRDLSQAVADKARVSELQWQRQQQLRSTMSAEQVLSLILAVAQSVQLHVRDRDERRAIQLEIQRITHQTAIPAE